MKQLYSLAILVVCLVGASIASTQAQSITKGWRLSFDESKTYMSQEQKDSFKYLDANAIKTLRQAFESTQYNFKANGSVQVAFYAGGRVMNQYAGTWKKSGNELLLFGIGGSQEDKEVFKIVKLTNRLLVVEKEDGSKVAFVAQ